MVYIAFTHDSSSSGSTNFSIDNGFTTRPEVLGRFGVVTSTNAAASAIGLQILDLGGNAFDAAVAVGFALQVVEPEFNGLGGEVVALVRTAGSGDARVLCGQGVAPRRATRQVFESLGYRQVPAVGWLAAAVPGAFDAWMLMLKDLGSMPLEAVLRPAIDLCTAGVPLRNTVCQKVTRVAARLQQPGWEASQKIYLPNGNLPKPYEIFRNHDLLSTLSLLAEQSRRAGLTREEGIQAARDFFYRGPIAAAIAKSAKQSILSDSAVESGGLIELSDLEAWEAHWEDALWTTYQGWTVFKPGPWSQGPVMLQHLNLLERAHPHPSRLTDSSYVHSIVETAKLAFADRDAYYGDPRFVNVPVEMLISREYASSRVREITEQANNGAITVLRAARSRAIDFDASSVSDQANQRGHEGDTCHLDIIDRDGNVVSATSSGGWFQDSPVVSDLGFSLNTRGQMFNLIEGHPNCIEPGKRPRTTLSPTIAIHSRGGVLAIGAPGADYQDQANLLVFLNCVHFGSTLQEAVEGHAFRSEHFVASAPPHRARLGVVTIESRFPQAEREALVGRGHILEVKADYNLNICTAAASDGLILRAAAGPSWQRGYAIGK